MLISSSSLHRANDQLFCTRDYRNADVSEMLGKSMYFDKALEFSVISSWDDLVQPEESNFIHVEYTNVDGVPLND